MNPELLTRCSIDEQPTQVIAASEAKLSLTFPPVRFVCKADELAFPGTEALNWLPNWVGLNATDPARLEQKIRNATAGDTWVVAGSYTQQSQATFWPRLETIIWLDMPLWLLLQRVLTRSWRRWRNKELLWGTNYEKFWDQLKVWNKEESLVWWVIHQYQPRRRQTFDYMTDPKWAHIRFIRLTSPAQLNQWLDQLALKTPNEHQ